MANKKSVKSLNFLYLIGMVLVAVGFCLPLFFTKLGGNIKAGKTTGFNFVNFDRDVVTSIAALLIFVGGIAGAVFSVIKLGPTKIIKIVCLAAVLVGAIVFVVKFNDSAVAKTVGKGLLKHAFVGLYMIVIGWVAAVVGFVKGK